MNKRLTNIGMRRDAAVIEAAKLNALEVTQGGNVEWVIDYSISLDDRDDMGQGWFARPKGPGDA